MNDIMEKQPIKPYLTGPDAIKYDLENQQITIGALLDEELSEYPGRVVEIHFRRKENIAKNYWHEGRYHLFYNIEQTIDILTILYSSQAVFYSNPDCPEKYGIISE